MHLVWRQAVHIAQKTIAWYLFAVSPSIKGLTTGCHVYNIRRPVLHVPVWEAAPRGACVILLSTLLDCWLGLAYRDPQWMY